MAERSSIEWTDATWNPWQGCTKVSPACKHCYMFRDLARYGKDPAVVRRSAEGTFRLPLKRGRDGQFKIPPGSKVFTCSWSDWFHADADPWRDEAWDIIRQRPDVIFQIVTKRTERIADHLPQDWGTGWPHVWIIATAENQEWLEVRIEHLAKIQAAVRGLSIEPLLGPVDLTKNRPSERMLRWHFPMTKYLDWVIVGGESGPGARPMHPRWVRSLRDQCVAAGVPFFFKQWGENSLHEAVETHPKTVSMEPPIDCGAMGKLQQWDREAGAFLPVPGRATVGEIFKGGAVFAAKVGRSQAGRELDGRTWDEFPVTDVLVG